MTKLQRMIEHNPIISIEEAREILGEDGKKLSNEEVSRLIEDLNFLARHAVKRFKEQHLKDR